MALPFLCVCSCAHEPIQTEMIGQTERFGKSWSSISSTRPNRQDERGNGDESAGDNFAGRHGLALDESKTTWRAARRAASDSALSPRAASRTAPRAPIEATPAEASCAPVSEARLATVDTSARSSAGAWCSRPRHRSSSRTSVSRPVQAVGSHHKSALAVGEHTRSTSRTRRPCRPSVVPRKLAQPEARLAPGSSRFPVLVSREDPGGKDWLCCSLSESPQSTPLPDERAHVSLPDASSLAAARRLPISSLRCAARISAKSRAA